ncbi:MAG: aliphatic sulfonate ABC transporter ATP-binding protein, partial [Armatimonadetes bacterium]|nr:aliphatic sulfonate ABC transporter ATP-binding protein [Armatimonadota bacterium]
IVEAVLLAARGIRLDAGRTAYTAHFSAPRPRGRANAEIAALTDELLTRILAPQAVADFAPSFTI